MPRNRKVCIAVAIMCKNEENNILTTLDSCLGAVHKYFIYDTGSTDNTLPLVEEWKKVNLTDVHIKSEDFVDFSTSRNAMLDWVDSFVTEDYPIDFILLVDCNDQLKNHTEFRRWVNDQYYNPSDDTAFYMSQRWESKSINRTVEYSNIHLIKPKCGWRYTGRIHETITQNVNNPFETTTSTGIPKSIYLYQERDEDDKKSNLRFASDAKLLLQDYTDNPTNPRTLFYLGQTYGCMAEWDESYKFYRLRTKHNNPKNIEENFLACHNLGDVTTRMIPGEPNFDAEKVKNPKTWIKAMKWFLQAHEILPRAEPLVFIANWYIKHKRYDVGEAFARLACQYERPVGSVMTVDDSIYSYKRWSHYAICGYFNGHYEDVIEAATKAFQYSKTDTDGRLQRAILDKCPGYADKLKAKWINEWKEKFCKGKKVSEKVANDTAERAWNMEVQRIKREQQQA